MVHLEPSTLELILTTQICRSFLSWMRISTSTKLNAMFWPYWREGIWTTFRSLYLKVLLWERMGLWWRSLENHFHIISKNRETNSRCRQLVRLGYNCWHSWNRFIQSVSSTTTSSWITFASAFLLYSMRNVNWNSSILVYHPPMSRSIAYSRSQLIPSITSNKTKLNSKATMLSAAHILSKVSAQAAETTCSQYCTYSFTCAQTKYPSKTQV